MSTPGPHAVINAYTYADRLPGSVEAFFMLDDEECSEQCQAHSAEAHRMFLAEYPRARNAVPLLAFNPSDAEQPFRDAMYQP